MPTLYLSPRYTDDSQLLWRASVELGWDSMRLSWLLMNHLAPSEVKNKVIYGETSFARMAEQALQVQLVDPPDFYLLELPEKFINRSLGAAILGDYLQYYAEPGFIKPVEKGAFEAKVYEDPRSQLSHVAKEIKILTSESVGWEVEFRCFVKDCKVKTLAPYCRNGALVSEAEAGEWYEAERFAEKVVEDSVGGLDGAAFVLDVGKIKGRCWSVVEANAAWGSGIYGCNPQEALRVVEKATREVK